MAKRAQVQMVPLTADHRERFRRDAPAALAQRSQAWFAEQSWGALEPALAGGVALVGLWLFGWSGVAVFGLALAAIWNAVACDVAKLALAHDAVQREAERWNADRSFWTIADAIREGKQEMRADSLTPYRPGMGLFVDFVFGGVATVVMLATVDESPLEVVAALTATGGARIALAAMLGLQWLATFATIVRHRRPGERSAMRFGAGARGLGLFLMMFPVVMSDEGARAMKVAVIMNAGLLLLAAISVFGLALMRRETEWLRDTVARNRSP
ncbi:MAG TPA: hypothetical protein VFL14_03275 [Xanthomonadales bacterium]|nr:hypothetical protein [Xanthomonadales bacterium]